MRRTRRRSCRSPTATWTSSTASSSTWRGRSTTRTTARCWRRCSPTRRCGPTGGGRPAPAAGTNRTPAEALRADWRRAPCTRGGHHAYLGGLLEHTVAVGTLALEACQLHPRLNSDLLICAALVHDLGKTREFTYGADIGLSEEGRFLGHIPLGQRLLDDRSGAMSVGKRLALAHCVLCHHRPDPPPGRRFGSGGGMALFRLNALSASVKGGLEHGLP